MNIGGLILKASLKEEQIKGWKLNGSKCYWLKN